MGLFMDIQTKPGGDWRRIEAEQAIKVAARRRPAAAAALGAEELDELLGDTETDPST